MQWYRCFLYQQKILKICLFCYAHLYASCNTSVYSLYKLSVLKTGGSSEVVSSKRQQQSTTTPLLSPASRIEFMLQCSAIKLQTQYPITYICSINYFLELIIFIEQNFGDSTTHAKLCCDLHRLSCNCSLYTQTAAWLHCCWIDRLPVT